MIKSKFSPLLIACFALLAFVVIAALPGCANKLPVQTPAQVAAQVCPPAQGALAAMGVLVLDPKLALDLAAVDTAVNLVCADVASVKTVDLKSLSTNAIPDLIKIVKAAPIPADLMDKSVLDLTLAQAALAAFVATQPAI